MLKNQCRSSSVPVGRLALVTGGSRGIGAAIACQLAEDGYDIWLNYRSGHDAARAVQQQICSAGHQCTLVPFDVSDRGEVEAALGPLLSEAVPSVLINNAGITRDGIFAMMSPADWDTVMAVNLGGFFHVTRLVLPLMLRRRAGHVVTITSTAGQAAVAGQVNYSAAKAGLIGATRSLAAEVGKRGVRINAVAPGFIETDMTSSLPKDKILPHIPLGRFGQVEDVAHAVSFLCSPAAGYITGQTLTVNGGIFI